MDNWVSRNIIFCLASFFFVVGLCFCSYAYSMERVIVLRDEGLYSALMARPALFDRKTVAALSAVSASYFQSVFQTIQYRKKYNKDCRALVLQSQEKRREYFLHKCPHLRTIPNLIWNEHGNVCALVSGGHGVKFTLHQGTRSNRPYGNVKEIMIECRYIWDSQYNPVYRIWDLFINVLPHQPRAFFKGAYDIYFHGYGGIDFQAFNEHVLEYHFRLPSESYAMICITDIGEDLVPLTEFLEFPLLLEAFLQSKSTAYTVGGLYKTFIFAGVTIPEDYDRHQQFFNKPKYGSFEDLSKKIRHAIIQRYNIQHPEAVLPKKKSKKKFGCFGS